MTTQYSPILKLALPVQGELSGTWGDVVNDNITSMVEQAIAGRAVINTWTTNSHTLTSANGTTSESRCAMLELTDTGTALSGAGTVVCPTASKIYIVKNAAGQNITVKTSGGTGILVPDGRTTFLFCDGTNVVEALTHTTSLQLGTSTTVTAVLDEDNMASNSATSLATQQSIKAYVDAQVGANNELSEVLANGNTSGANDIIVDNGQKITTNTIDETTAGSGVTIDSVLLKDDGVNATNLEVTNIKANDGTTAATIADSTGVVTIPSAVLTTADINGGTADGVVIGGSTPAAATATTVTANTSLTIAGTTTVTSILDEDNMSSDDPAGLATQQSIKAYVDAQVGANNELSEILANGNTTGGTDISVSTGDDITFADSSKAIFGAGSDLQIYHDPATGSYISEVGAGSLFIQSNNNGVIIEKNTGENLLFADNTTGSLKLYHNNDLKLATTSTGVDITGNATFADNGKAIFGAGSNLQIYNDGTHNYIEDTATGNLYIQGTNLILKNQGGTENLADFVSNGAVTLYYDNAAKFATTSTGVDITGTITSDGLTVGSTSYSSISTSEAPTLSTDAHPGEALWLRSGGTSGSGNVQAVLGFGKADGGSGRTGAAIASIQTDADADRVGLAFYRSGSSASVQTMAKSFELSHNGDITFYDTSGNASFVYDESAGSTFNEQGADRDFRVESDTNTHALFVDAGNNRVKVGGSGTDGAAIMSVYDDKDNSASNWFDDRTGLELYNYSQPAGYGTSVGIFLEAHSGESAYMYSEAPSNGNVTGYIGARTSGTNNRDLIFWTPSSVTINDDSYDVDFRVESDGNANMLFVDASANAIGIGTSLPREMLHVSPAGNGDATIALGDRDQVIGGPHGFRFYHQDGTAGDSSYFNFRTGDDTLNIEDTAEAQHIKFYTLTGGATFNETGRNDADFRVESDTRSAMLFVDAATDRVGINTDAPQETLEIRGKVLIEANNSGATVTPGNQLILSDSDTSIDANQLMGQIAFNTSDSTNPGTAAKIQTRGTNDLGSGELQIWSGTPGGINKNVHFRGDQVVFNEDSHDMDFRVESDSSTHALFVDASLNRVGINQSNPGYIVDVVQGGNSNLDGVALRPLNQSQTMIYSFLGMRNTYFTHFISDSGNTGGSDYFKFFASTEDTAGELLMLDGDGTIFNEGGGDRDFRVESDSNTHALFVDAGNDAVGINTNSIQSGYSLTVRNGGAFITSNGTANTRNVLLRLADGTYFPSGSPTIHFSGYQGGGNVVNSYIQYNPGGSMDFYSGAFTGDGTKKLSLGSTVVVNEDSTDTDFRIESDANANCFKVDAGADSGLGTVLFGQSTASATTKGAYFSSGANDFFHFVVAHQSTTTSLAVQYINRQASDGRLVEFRQANSFEGEIAVSGSTVSYNGFAGRHESSGIPTTTVKGTVVSTIDELDVYISGAKQGQTRADHAKVKISDTVGESCVYGAVDDFTEDGKVNVISVGIGAVLVTGSCSKGDLLESNGDGTAKVQSDDIVRSKTLGKVTIGNSDTGVKLVSCVMYCG